MKPRLFFKVWLLALLPTMSGFSANWYLATNGLDSNAGTQSAPFATLMQAQSAAVAGDTVFINAGTYYPTSQYPTEDGVYVPVNLINKSGITYEAMPGTRPVFNFSLVNPSGLRSVAFWVIANNVTFQGFDVVAVQENITGVNNQSVGFANWGCNFCVWNQVNVHDADCVGIYFEQLDASNLVYRCDCYNLAGIDSYSYGNADGFGCHVSAGGTGNVFRECRSWNNSDDGYDCINCSEPVTFDHCWSYKNGNNGGNGNGFKVGGWASSPQNQIPDPIPNHIVFNCLAVGNNGNAGFYANHQPAGPGAPTGWTNNTAYANAVGYSLLQRTPPDYTTNGDETDANDISGTNEAMHNNLVYADTYQDIENFNETSSPLASSNSWTETGVTVSAADFVSTTASQMTNARAADGSLPVITLMHLVPADHLTGLGCFVVPTAPTNLAMTVSSGQIGLSWAQSPGATGYNVKRSTTTGGPYTNIANDVTNLNYTDAGLSNNTTYYYVVSALNPGDESTNSTQISVLSSFGPFINAASGSPNPVMPGQLVTISATVAADVNPVATVTANLGAIGGLSNQLLVPDGTGNYTNTVTVGAATPTKAQTLTINAVDTLGDPSAPYPFVLNIQALTATWDGGGGDNNWSDVTNWTGNVAPGYDYNLIFAGTSRLAPVMDASYGESAVTFDNTAGAFTIGTTSGNILTLAGGVTNNSANVQALNLPLVLGAASTINAALDDLMLGQAVTNGGNLLALTDGGHNITMGGTISGTGGLAKSGTGTSTLSDANTFNGTTAIAQGTLQLANALALQDSALIYTNGRLAFSGITAATLGGLTGSQNLGLTNSAGSAVALSVGGNNLNSTCSGALSGTGASLTKTGTGTLTLSGNNSYSGATTVSAGVLQLSAGGVINGAAANVVDGAELIVSGGSLTAGASGNMGAGAAISLLVSAGSATFNGGLTTDLNQNTSDFIDVTGGSLTAASVAMGRTGLSDTTQPTAGSTSAGLYVNGGTVRITGNLDMSSSGSANSSVSARIDNGSLTVGGTVTIGLNNGGRWSVLDVNGGTFTVTNTTTGVSVGGPDAGNAELLIRSGTASIGRIGLGQGTTVETAIVNLTGGSLYVGGGGIVQSSTGAGFLCTNILSGGILGAITNWSSSVAMTLAGGTIQAADVSGVAHSITLGGVLSGSGALNKTGGGSLTLGGANGYTGGTTVSGGTLLVNNPAGSGTGSGTVSVANGGTLGGTGIISGPVIVNLGGNLTPGNPLGALVINNSLLLNSGSTVTAQVQHSPLTNSVARISGALTNGGNLIVNGNTATLAGGDTFKLFNAASYHGTFSTTALPALRTGLSWDASQLNTAGVISVVVSAMPTFGSVSISSAGFVFSGTGGVGSGNFVLLGATNFVTPMSNWTRLWTNQFDAGGNFSFTNTISPAQPQSFYRLLLQ